MLLTRIKIRNFRGIAHLDINLDETTVLIGENNTGKTSVLEAIYTCLGRSLLSKRSFPFTEHDFYLSNSGAIAMSAPPIEITLEFTENIHSKWGERTNQALNDAIQIADNGILSINFRLRAFYELSVKDYVLETAFLNAEGQVLTKARSQSLVGTLQQFSPAFLLAAIRDAAHHFSSRGVFWTPFAKNPDLTPEKQTELESQLEEINRQVVDGHLPFQQVKTAVAKAAGLVPLSTRSAVSIEAVPTKVYDLLSRTQLKLASRSEAKLPVDRHGAGTQSLSVIFLFEAFLRSRLAEAYDQESTPILALEEPESHLHPSAVRSLWGGINSLAGQKIIATHSGELMAEVPLKSIRRLARKNGQLEVFQIAEGALDSDEEDDLSYVVRSERGALFFARCWLLVEGKTEYTLLPALGRALNSELTGRGVAVIEFAQCNCEALIKVARQLGIEWHVLVDGDSQGQAYAQKVRRLVGADNEVDRLTVLPEKDIEHHFWHNGFSAIIDRAVGTNQRTQMIRSLPGTPEYIGEVVNAARKTWSKPGLARKFVKEVEDRRLITPPLIAGLLTKVIQLADLRT